MNLNQREVCRLERVSSKRTKTKKTILDLQVCLSVSSRVLTIEQTVNSREL